MSRGKTFQVEAALLCFAWQCLPLAMRAAPAPCETCHAAITAKYKQTGMGRSFFMPAPENTVEDYTGNNRYFHAPSGIHYTMTRRDGGYFQSRYQIGLNGEHVNEAEERVDYVLGSGNHARTYLHRKPDGSLVQLPLAWYAEKGGYWAMSPGYDTPDHPGSGRPVGSDCMFCHNAYPVVTNAPLRAGDVPHFAATVPQGIDCQRCHGTAGDHPAKPAVNPARLAAERSMEVCLQCHLEPDSFRPALNLRRYDRSWDSYRPGEPLANFMLFFDAQPAGGIRNDFQIAGTAYEFRRSACFRMSAGRLQCTTCHDPHEEQHGSAAAVRFNAVCQSCHAAPANHTAKTECVGCHMQKRRTADVVHVTMTDHYIRPAPIAGDLLAELAEKHEVPKAEVEAYYPANAPLYLAMARVRNGERLTEALPVVRALGTPEAWFDLAEAERRAGHLQEAVQAYRSALASAPGYLPAAMGLGGTLRERKQPLAAEAIYKEALGRAPQDARLWSALGETQLELKRLPDADFSLRKSVALDQAFPDPHNWLGILEAQAGHAKEAEEEFRAAIRLGPNQAQPHANLANLLALEGYGALARVEFEAAVRYAPADGDLRLRFAALLNETGQFDEARKQLEAALRANAHLAAAHRLLGNLLERAGEREGALGHYREAAREDPSDLRTQLDLGAVLKAEGNSAEATGHLRRAAVSPDPGIRRLATALLKTP